MSVFFVIWGRKGKVLCTCLNGRVRVNTDSVVLRIRQHLTHHLLAAFSYTEKEISELII